MKRVYDKVSANAMKGIAILLLIHHHNFQSKSALERIAGIIYSPLTLEQTWRIAQSMKLCVGIFVFITGYGLYQNYMKKVYLTGLNEAAPKNALATTKWVLVRELKVLSGFWIIFLLSTLICQFADGRTYDVFFDRGLIQGAVNYFMSFMGLGRFFKLQLFNGTWWYMSAIVVFIVFIPIFVHLIEKFGGLTPLLLCVAIPRLLNTGFTSDDYTPMYFFILIIGMIFSKYDLVNKWINLTFKKHGFLGHAIKLIIEAAVIILMARAYKSVSLKTYWEFHYGIFPLAVLLFAAEFIVIIPVIRPVLAFLGRHSLNIFLTHTFIRYYYFMDFTYSFKYPLLIDAVLLAISVAISVVLELIKKLIRYNKLMEYVEKKILSFQIIKDNIQESQVQT